MKLPAPLLIGSSAIAVLAIGGIGYWAQKVGAPQSLALRRDATNPTANAAQRCLTLVSDSTPPLNVRSSPLVTPDNVIGRLKNGTRLVVSTTEGEWLQIQAPIAGWVYKSLTFTHCTPVDETPTAAQTQGAEASILAAATEQYQSGQLEVAIALAQSIPNTSPRYEAAQAAIAQWQQDWQLAATQFNAAQAALHQGQWQEVLDQVNGFPDIRFWREKLTPVVKAAIEQQGSKAENYDHKTEQITLPADNQPATIAGRFQGPGSHRYLLSGVQGQSLTIETGGLGPLPSITAPNGTSLNQGTSATKTRWIGKLPASGTYTLKLKSDVQPYDYAFSVQLN